MNQRTQIAKGIFGSGIEIGPGLDPIQLEPGVSVTYIDKPLNGGYATAHGLNSQIEQTISLEYDIDTAGMLWAKQLDINFIIACHLIEHLANPIRFLQESWESLPLGGKLLLIVPDRELSFDFGRSATSLDHFLEEFNDQCEEVSELHIRQELAHSMGLINIEEVPRHEIEKWRELTVHAHCWNGPEFVAMIMVCMNRKICNWKLEASYWPETTGNSGFEFGLLLTKEALDENCTVRFLGEYIRDVILSFPGERARWPHFVNFLSSEFNYFGLDPNIDPSGLLPLLVHEFELEDTSKSQINLNDLRPQVFAASRVPNSPFGLGRVAAYWRRYLAEGK